MWWHAFTLHARESPPTFGVRKSQAKVGWSRFSPIRRLRNWFWMSKGSKASDSDDWEMASRCFRKAVRARPDDLSAWEESIFAELMIGNKETANRLIGEANGFVSLSKLEVMMMRLYAAWFHDDTERTCKYVNKLAQMDIHMAKAVVHHLMIDTQNLDPPRRPGSTNESHDWIDGYA